MESLWILKQENQFLVFTLTFQIKLDSTHFRFWLRHTNLKMININKKIIKSNISKKLKINQIIKNKQT